MIYLSAILVYLFVLTGISIHKSRQVKNQADFAVAGRTLPPWVLVCTMLAAWIGTGSIVGNAGQTYKTGLAAIIIPLGSVFGMLLLTWVAPRARNYQAESVPEIIGARYGHAARILAVISLIIAYMVILSYQFNAGGGVLEVILTDSSGQPMLTSKTATIIAAVFIIAYTMLAGLMSLASTDILTGIIITLSLFIALPVLWFKAGGWQGMEQAFAAMPDKTNHMRFWGVYSKTNLINFILPPFLLILGDANQYQRLFASKSAKGARTAVIFMIFAVLVIESLIILEAWISSSMIPDAAVGKYVMIYAAKEILPLALGLLMLVTIVGIIVSTADSFLLVPATCFIRDIYMNYINPRANEKRIVFLSRLLVLIFGIIGYLVSLLFAESKTIFEKALYAYTIYGVSITPCLVAAMFWRRATTQGAVASILSGTVITLLWELKWFQLPQAIDGLDAVLPAFAVSVSALIFVSLMTKPNTTYRKV